MRGGVGCRGCGGPDDSQPTEVAASSHPGPTGVTGRIRGTNPPLLSRRRDGPVRRRERSGGLVPLILPVTPVGPGWLEAATSVGWLSSGPPHPRQPTPPLISCRYAQRRVPNDLCAQPQILNSHPL